MLWSGQFCVFCLIHYNVTLRIWVVDEDKKLLIWEGVVKNGQNMGMS